MQGHALLQAELTKRYGNVIALNDVSFTITDGVTGILGENGAGKSTAIRIFLGLLRPTSGRATVLGEDASENVGVRARLGYMPEHDCLPAQVSAAEFLTHMAEVSGLPPATARTRAADTLRHTGLFEERYRAIGGYSTGMKQRVKLAQALVHDPAFVFLDEPTAGPRSGRPRGDARARAQDAPRLRHQRAVLVAPDVRRRAHVRPHHRAAGRPARRVRRGRSLHEGDGDRVHRGRHEPRPARRRARAARRRVTEEGGGLTIEGPDESIYDLVRDALVEAEAPLRRMAPRRRALSELFEAGRSRNARTAGAA
jgi:ABC-2 type transport system ATP-binding protein